ncbi:hypothetical protein M3J09_004565 [Ascochyta lentis]
MASCVQVERTHHPFVAVPEGHVDACPDPCSHISYSASPRSSDFLLSVGGLLALRSDCVSHQTDTQLWPCAGPHMAPT